jgi:hypothetical protein
MATQSVLAENHGVILEAIWRGGSLSEVARHPQIPREVPNEPGGLLTAGLILIPGVSSFTAGCCEVS